MLRRSRIGPRRWAAAISAAVAALALAAAAFFVATPAHAATGIQENFEGNPYLRWKTEEFYAESFVNLGPFLAFAPGVGGIAFLDAYPAPATAKIYRQSVVIPRPTPVDRVACQAYAYIAKFEASRPAARVVLRLWAGSRTTGTLISDRRVDVNVASFQQYFFSSFDYRSDALTIEISVTGGTILVDDVTISCWRDPQ
jgi:hypothetical protein